MRLNAQNNTSSNDYINASYVNVSMCMVAVQFIVLTCGCVHLRTLRRLRDGLVTQ